MSGMDEIEKKVAEKRAGRLLYDYDIPAEEGLPFKSISVVELTPAEERMAGKRAGNEGMRLMHELAKACLRQVVTEADEKVDIDPMGNQEAIWKELGPRGRSYVTTAYADLHNPTDAGVQSFRKSRKVRTT